MYVLQKLNRFVIPRTELTYPCHQLKMHQNAAAAPVDHVMPDFEDACPYDFKGEPSRNTMVEALKTVDFGAKVIAIRPNNIRSKYFLGDMEAIMLGAPDRFHGIILPKTEAAEDISYLSKLLDALEEQGDWTTRVQIEALIETPLGVINAYRIATASERMAGLIFGIADFAATMGVRENVENQNQNFHYAKQATVVAAKAAGLHAIDNAYLRLVRKDTPEDEAERIYQGLREKSTGSANIGMDGTWVIHPQQAEIANECFTPSDEVIEKSKTAIEYYHKVGGGSIYNPETDEFDDEATIKAKLVDLAKAVQAGKLDPEWLAAQSAKSKEVSGYDILEVMRRVA
ncbi:MAG: aldolase/citrate lyase family protein [Dehalococcoidia bacterium]|nr:aldolase/citrate lyase family protein [Dehalococcoidia bacterium]